MYSFSHMAFSMKNVTWLNNTHEYSYKLPHSGLEEIAPNELELNFILWIEVFEGNDLGFSFLFKQLK